MGGRVYWVIGSYRAGCMGRDWRGGEWKRRRQGRKKCPGFLWGRVGGLERRAWVVVKSRGFMRGRVEGLKRCV